MRLADLFDEPAKGRVLVVGNGPSLDRIPDRAKTRLLDWAEAVVGVNRAWRWCRLDWWVAADGEQIEGRWADGPMVGERWAVYGPEAERRGLGDPGPGVVMAKKRGRSLEEAMIVRGWFEREGDALCFRSTTTLPAIHLALVLLRGRGEVRMAGVDLGCPGNRRHFGTRPLSREVAGTWARIYRAQAPLLDAVPPAFERVRWVCLGPAAGLLRNWAEG